MCLKWHLVQGCQTESVLLKDSVKLLSNRRLFSYILIWWDGGEAWKYVFLEISVSECLCVCVCVHGQVTNKNKLFKAKINMLGVAQRIKGEVKTTGHKMYKN